MIGKIFGRLTVIKFSHSNKGRYWFCDCDCGNKTTVRTSYLNSGSIKSCGCGAKEQVRKNFQSGRDKKSHGFQHGAKLSGIYYNMMHRCNNPKNKAYKNYGERGIFVCEDWKNDNRLFYKWCSENGYKPGLSIDRINNDDGYYPDNCRFTDRKTQQNNTRRNKLKAKN